MTVGFPNRHETTELFGFLYTQTGPIKFTFRRPSQSTWRTETIARTALWSMEWLSQKLIAASFASQTDSCCGQLRCRVLER